VPGDQRHDESRGWSCVERGTHARDTSTEPCVAPEPATQIRSSRSHLVRRAAGVLGVRGLLDRTGNASRRWRIDPSDPRWKGATWSSAAQEGCSLLPFSPSILLEASTSEASKPTGLHVDVHVPQDSTLATEGLGEAAVKQTTVALPPDIQLNPSAANGLAGARRRRVGFTKRNPETQTDEFTNSPATCPDGSKMGTVRVKDADLPNELEGFVYLATPQNFAGPPPKIRSNHWSRCISPRRDPVSGVLVKLAGEVHLDEADRTDLLDVQEHAAGPLRRLQAGVLPTVARVGLLASLCGSYSTAGVLHAVVGDRRRASSTSFAISSGPAAPAAPIRRPSRRASWRSPRNLQAGGFTPFTVDITRHDSDQAVQGVSMRLPPGIAGMLSKVERCTSRKRRSERVLQRARSATRP